MSSPENPSSIRRFREWITASVPLLATVLLHLLLVSVAAAIVVQQTTAGRKKTFEASAKPESVAAQQVEHRLQIARRGGASGASSSPIPADRIFSAASNALQMPEMPELPGTGAVGFGGFGGMGSGVGLGAGTGMATSLGSGAGLGGRGFMSLNFLGLTSQNAQNVVFVVDTGAAIMDLRKGGFRAFTIIREEIMRLVSRLPPSANFNVVLFAGTDMNLHSRELIPATSANKKEFFGWMAAVNTTHTRLGPFSAPRRVAWESAPLPPDSGVDPTLLPPVWAHGARVALEQKADTIFVITAAEGSVLRRVDEATAQRRRADVEKRRADLERQGIDVASVQAARRRSESQARRDFDEANRRIVAAGGDPIIITDVAQIFSPHVQSALRRHGITITRDLEGWTDKQGRAIDVTGLSPSELEGASWNDFHGYLARLQRAFVPKRSAINLFLFVGPDDKAESAVEILTDVARRNDGRFQLLTTRRLEELQARSQSQDNAR